MHRIGKHDLSIVELHTLLKKKEKKVIFLLAMMAVVVFGASSAMAEATVIKEFGCQIIPADSGLPVLLTTTDKTSTVESASGNVNFTCRFTFDPKVYPVKKTLQHEGFACSTQFGVTKNTSAVTTPGGQVTLKCKIKEKKK